MKRIILILSIIAGSLGTIEAQQNRQPEPQQREEKIKALYVAFISQELKLTEDEAQKFWPIHTQFDSEIRAVGLDLPELERQQTVLNIKKKYQDRFSRILGNERTDNFFRKDMEFRKKLIERLKNMRMQNGKQRQQLRGN